ncbi:MAG: hypothetical protein ACI9G1_000563 [Pirellulaceae bacterium]|jgi:hypothetical protein
MNKLVLGLIIVSLTLSSSEASAQRDDPQVVFRNVVQPFIKRHCIKCHGEKKSAADLSLHLLGGGN